MELNSKHIRQFAIFYLCCFEAIFCWLYYHGLLLHQIQPVFFINRLDVTANIILATGLPKLLLHNYTLQVIVDCIYCLLPALLVVAVLYNKRVKILAVLTALFCLTYSLLLGMYSFFSPEILVSWFFIPLLFFTTNTAGFSVRFSSLRYLFILFFLSAGVWKISAGGLFQYNEMSAILAMQHKQILINNPDNWYSTFILFLIKNATISYIIYLLGTLSELAFVVGFFTKKHDRLLLILLFLFCVFDLVFMRINYFSWIVFAGLFYFSKYTKATTDKAC